MSKTTINIGSLVLSHGKTNDTKPDPITIVDVSEGDDAILLELSNGQVVGLALDLIRAFLEPEVDVDAVSPFGFDLSTQEMEDEDEDEPDDEDY